MSAIRLPKAESEEEAARRAEEKKRRETKEDKKRRYRNAHGAPFFRVISSRLRAVLRIQHR